MFSACFSAPPRLRVKQHLSNSTRSRPRRNSRRLALSGRLRTPVPRRIGKACSANRLGRETDETFNHCAKIKYFFALESIAYAHCTPDSLAFACYFRIVERQRGPLAQPQQFSCWPACVAFEVVLTSRKPLEAQRGSPSWRRPAGRISV